MLSVFGTRAGAVGSRLEVDVLRMEEVLSWDAFFSMASWSWPGEQDNIFVPVSYNRTPLSAGPTLPGYCLHETSRSFL